MGTVQVIGRVVFQTPIYGYSDMIEQIMTIFAFLAIAYTQRLGGHVRMELFAGSNEGAYALLFRNPRHDSCDRGHHDPGILRLYSLHGAPSKLATARLT